MVGAHNTVDVCCRTSGAHGGLRWLLQEGWTSVPSKYHRCVGSPTTCTRCGESRRSPPMSRDTWGVFLPYGSPNGAYNIVDINVGAYNTVDTNVGTFHTACVRSVVEHCSRRHAGYGPGTVF